MIIENALNPWVTKNDLNPWITVAALTFFLVVFDSLAYYYVLRLDGYFGYAHEDINLIYYYILIFLFYASNIGALLNIWYSGFKKLYYVDCPKCNGLMSQKASICPGCHFNYGKSYSNCHRNIEEHYFTGTSIFKNRHFLIYPLIGLFWFFIIMSFMKSIGLNDFSLIFFWSIYFPMGLCFIFLKKYLIGWSSLIASIIYTIFHVLALSKGSNLEALNLLLVLGSLALAFMFWRWYRMFKEVIAKWAVLPENYWLNKEVIDEGYIEEYAKSSIVHCVECDLIIRIQESKSNSEKYICPNCHEENFRSLSRFLLDKDGLEY